MCLKELYGIFKIAVVWTLQTNFKVSIIREHSYKEYVWINWNKPPIYFDIRGLQERSSHFSNFPCIVRNVFPAYLTYCVILQHIRSFSLIRDQFAIYNFNEYLLTELIEVP